MFVFGDFVFALSMGVLALLSPCGFPLIPTYISYYLGVETSTREALAGGVASTLGIISVMLLLGTVVSLFGQIISVYITVLELTAAIFLILMGFVLLLDIRIPLPSWVVTSKNYKGVPGFFVFGATLGVTITGCTAPLFLAVIVYSFTQSGVLDGVLTFATYGIGMGLPLILTSLLVAQGKELLLRRLAQVTPHLSRIGGVILIIAGIFIAYGFLTAV